MSTDNKGHAKEGLEKNIKNTIFKKNFFTQNYKIYINVFQQKRVTILSFLNDY
tara:strand:- start:918 stop:1076 length:159 start_codon:yes stop_codon:yes gene_type:complete